jgi:choice-of-anchor B domain-containing protein
MLIDLFTTRTAGSCAALLVASLCIGHASAGPEGAYSRSSQGLAGLDEDAKVAWQPSANQAEIFGRGSGPDMQQVVEQFDKQNIDLLSWVPLGAFAGNQASGNDCWGYTSPSGREYAILGLEAGFGFVEITDPRAPVVIATIPGPSSMWHDIKVMGTHAYGVSEGGAGIQVIDLSQIDSGIVTLVQNRQQNGHSTTHNIAANTDSGYVYLTGANIANGGLVAVDVTTNPNNPNIVGSWGQFYVHDAQVVTYTSGPYAGREIAFCLSGTGNGSGSTALRIVDVTNKANMFTISTSFWAAARYAHQGWLTTDRNHFYINDELDEGNSVSVTTTRIFNVEDLASPSFVGIATSGVAAIDHNLYTTDRYMFQSNYRSGLRVFDILDPTSPQQVAYFDTYPGSDSAVFNGAWSNYPYFPSGTIIVSDIERGLFVLRLAIERLDIVTQGAPPTSLSPDNTQQIVATITEVDRTLDPATVRLVYTDSEGTSTVNGVPLGNNTFSFNFQNLVCFDQVDYYFEAFDTTGQLYRLPTAAPGVSFSGIVASEVDNRFADNGETNPGWTVSGITAANAGGWSRGLPQGNGRGDPATDFDGSGRCWLTGISGSTTNTDVDNGSTLLTSPSFDASGSQEVYAQYAIWYSNSFGASPFEDIFTVELSNDNGASWTLLQTIGPASPDRWELFRFRIDNILPPTSSMRLRFTASDLGSGSVVEAGVDAVLIEAINCEQTPACLGDFADDFGTVAPAGGPDGTVSFGDFLALLGLIGPCQGGSPGCLGDLADDFGTIAPAGGPDGAVSFGDFLALLGLIGPCP